jgi:hypothetical protein
MVAELAASNNVSIAAMHVRSIPEPACWLLAVVGLGPLWWHRQVRKGR